MGADLDGHFDYRMQASSTIGTITRPDLQIRITVIGRDAYERIDRGHIAGRWLRYPAQPFKQFTPSPQYASTLFSGYDRPAGSG